MPGPTRINIPSIAAWHDASPFKKGSVAFGDREFVSIVLIIPSSLAIFSLLQWTFLQRSTQFYCPSHRPPNNQNHHRSHRINPDHPALTIKSHHPTLNPQNDKFKRHNFHPTTRMLQGTRLNAHPPKQSQLLQPSPTIPRTKPEHEYARGSTIVLFVSCVDFRGS